MAGRRLLVALLPLALVGCATTGTASKGQRRRHAGEGSVAAGAGGRNRAEGIALRSGDRRPVQARQLRRRRAVPAGRGRYRARRDPRRRRHPRARGAQRAAFARRQPRLQRARQALPGDGQVRWLCGERPGVVLRQEIPWSSYLQPGGVRHVRLHRCAQDPAVAELCTGHQSGQRQVDRGSHQRSRAVPPGSGDRSQLRRCGQAGLSRPRHRAGRSARADGRAMERRRWRTSNRRRRRVRWTGSSTACRTPWQMRAGSRPRRRSRLWPTPGTRSTASTCTRTDG